MTYKFIVKDINFVITNHNFDHSFENGPRPLIRLNFRKKFYFSESNDKIVVCSVERHYSNTH